jgi:hypothetical protein
MSGVAVGAVFNDVFDVGTSRRRRIRRFAVFEKLLLGQTEIANLGNESATISFGRMTIRRTTIKN